MKILFEHPCVLPVIKYGGTERLIYWIMEELVKRGHEVYFIGLKQSTVSDIGVKLIEHNKGDWRELIPKDIDLVHLFYTPDWDLDFPLLVTMGGNGKIGEQYHLNTVFVSKKHAQLHGSESFIHNCISLREYPYEKRPQLNWDSFMFLAKGSWKIKNLKHCIKACKSTKKHLHIAGGKSIMPSRYIHSYGMVAQEDKSKIFKQVDGLLFPVLWHEPFGIAIIEMMSQGQPVIGSTYGSLPELIIEGTGFTCKNYDEFLSRIKGQNPRFDQDFIRNYVETNFSVETFTESYLQCYERILSGEVLNSKVPVTQSRQHPEVLLPF